MGCKVFEAGKAAMGFSRRMLLGLLEEIPQDRWLHQPCAGGNHAQWIAGHIASEDDDVLTKLKPRPSKLPDGWVAQFGMGSTPSPDARKYPSKGKVMEVLASQREELLSWFASMDEVQLSAPVPDDWKSFAPTYGALMPGLAWHEGLHTGQLTVVRKSLGIKPRFA